MQNPDAPRSAGAAGLHYGFVVLGLVVLVVFSALGLARFGYTSILPAMQEALQLSNQQAGALQSWNLVGYLATVVFAGALASRFGPRRVIAVGLLIVAAGMAFTALVPAFGAACAGRFLAGVGGASSNVPAIALLSAWFGARRRGVAAGVGVGGSSVALIVTGPLIPAILQRGGADGWRISWCVLAAMTLFVCVVAALFLRNRPSEKGLGPIGECSSVDPWSHRCEENPSSGSERKETGESDPALREVGRVTPCAPLGDRPDAAVGSRGAHGVTRPTFPVRWQAPDGKLETRPVASANSALNWGSVFRSSQLWKLAGIYFGFGFSYIIYTTFFVRHLTGEAGFSRAAAGALWMQVGMVSLVSGFVWGGVSDRWGRRAALLWVFGLQGASFLLFGLSRDSWCVYLSAALFALTAWSVPALMAALCGDLFGARLAPAALGLVTLVFGLGQALAPWLAGAIADAAHSFAPAFLVAGATALLVGGGGTLLFLRGATRP